MSEKEEKIMTLKSSPAHSNWTKMVAGFISKEERKVKDEKNKLNSKNFSEIMSLISHTNKKVRDSAAEALNNILKNNAEVAEAEMNSILDNKKTNDELRGYSRSDESRHFEDDVDSKMVDVLISTVSSRFDISKRYYKLKAQLLGVKKLEYHERNVSYGKIDKKYSYEESIKIINSVFKKLDREFSEVMESLINGKIDVYPKKGKSDGAFCSSSLLSQPTYILLNHNEKLNDVLTIAHELGHGINNELMKKKQNSLNFDNSLCTAEVASTFMEDFVLEELKAESNDELKLALDVMKLNGDISTIFRQVACYKFEQELHVKFREKGYLSKEEIGEIFKKHMSSYMGDYVEKSEGCENWWVYWGHIRTFFYVYSYASGLLISKSLQNSVKKNPMFVEKVKGFLSAGLSDSPRNIFAKFGIDITSADFWNKGIDEVEKLLEETEKLAKKLKKI